MRPVTYSSCRRRPVSIGRWFDVGCRRRAPFPQPDAELAARAKRYQGAELPANYEWNAQAVVNAVCKGNLRNVVAFDRFEDVYEFDAD